MKDETRQGIEKSSTRVFLKDREGRSGQCGHRANRLVGYLVNIDRAVSENSDKLPDQADLNVFIVNCPGRGGELADSLRQLPGYAVAGG